MKVIITGATGMVGEGVLMECIANSRVSSILHIGRKPSGKKHPKLTEYIVADFFELKKDDLKLSDYDACFYCVGISSNGLNEEDYTRITFDTTLHFAKILLAQNQDMVFNFVSGASTDSSEKGKIMWARVKGKTENALMALSFKAEYNFRSGYLLISHDHYDHLNYETVLALKDKIKHVICGLGVGAHFELWGYRKDQIIEKDWYEKVDVAEGFSIYTESTQHESGRGFKRGKSLWISFLIESSSTKVYISGDGGYDQRFKKIEEKYGEINWAIMENGQYNKAWQSVHNLPEEVDQATIELRAQNLLTVHHSKFTLGRHPWDEPLRKISSLSENKPYKLATPMIGELVYLDNPNQKFEKWWEGIN